MRYRCSARSQSPRRQKGTVGGLEKTLDTEDDDEDEDGDEDDGKKEVKGDALMDGEWSVGGFEGPADDGEGGGESEKLLAYSSAC